uniref:Coleoptericin 2 n=1 Tax=Sitophilus zeamais TaxID=7047 RepID=B6RQP6_SITZE|nr:coleoptericin 2 [Sitophilus zeamais]
MAKLSIILMLATIAVAVSASNNQFPKPITSKPPFNPRPVTFRPLRLRRSASPNPDDRPEWEVKPDIIRDENGNTRAQVEVNQHGRNHDVNAGWGKNIRGPGSHRDTWHVGGAIRW